MVELFTLKVFDADGKIIGQKDFVEFPEYGDIEEGIKSFDGIRGSICKIFEILPFA